MPFGETKVLLFSCSLFVVLIMQTEDSLAIVMRQIISSIFWCFQSDKFTHRMPDPFCEFVLIGTMQQAEVWLWVGDAEVLARHLSHPGIMLWSPGTCSLMVVRVLFNAIELYPLQVCCGWKYHQICRKQSCNSRRSSERINYFDDVPCFGQVLGHWS